MPHTSSLGSDQTTRENFLQYVVEEMLHLLRSPDPAKPGYIQRREETEKQQAEVAQQQASAANTALTPSSSSTSLSTSDRVAPSMSDSMYTARSSDASHSSPHEGDTLPASGLSKTQRKKQAAAARKTQSGSEQGAVRAEVLTGTQQDTVTGDGQQVQVNVTGDDQQAQVNVTGDGQQAQVNVAGDGQPVQDSVTEGSTPKSYPGLFFGLAQQFYTTHVLRRAYDPLVLTKEKLKMARALEDALRRIKCDCKSSGDDLAKGLAVVTRLVTAAEKQSTETLKSLSASPKEFEETLRTMLAVLTFFSEPGVDSVRAIVAKYDSEIKTAKHDAVTLNKEFYSEMLRVAFDIWFDALRDTQKTVVAYERLLPKDPGDALIKQIYEIISDADKLAAHLTPEEALRYTLKDVGYLLQAVEDQQTALKAATYLWATDNTYLKGLSDMLETWKERIREAQQNTNEKRSAVRPAA